MTPRFKGLSFSPLMPGGWDLEPNNQYRISLFGSLATAASKRTPLRHQNRNPQPPTPNCKPYKPSNPEPNALKPYLKS